MNLRWHTAPRRSNARISHITERYEHKFYFQYLKSTFVIRMVSYMLLSNDYTVIVERTFLPGQ